MFTLNRKNKIAIVSIASVALMLVMLVPYASAQPISTTASTSNARTLKAVGIAYQNVNGQINKFKANFTLTVQPTSTFGSIKEFNVLSGTVFVNGIPYSIASGNGIVRTGRHIFMLQAQGTGPDGKAIAFKLEGKYFYMWGHLYVARIGAKLETYDGNYTMLMRSTIRL